MSARWAPAITPGRARVHAVAMLLAVVATAACGDDLPTNEGSSSSGLLLTTSSTTDDSTSTTGAIAPASSDEGASTTGSSTTGPSTVGIPDECTLSSDCPDGELCVAPFDQSAGPEGKGATECVTVCVMLMDEDRWCADAAACCDPLHVCTDRGYCVDPEQSTGSSDGSGSSGGSSGGSTGSGSTG
jgi:hypothetical protein